MFIITSVFYCMSGSTDLLFNVNINNDNTIHVAIVFSLLTTCEEDLEGALEGTIADAEVIC